MKEYIQYAWALREGVRVHINDFNTRRGKGYVCIVCGGRMIARKGEHQAFHFAHVIKTECSPPRRLRRDGPRYYNAMAGKLM